MDNGIRNLVFDFGGVLIDIDPRRCVEEFEKLGFGPAEELIGKYWQRGVFRDFELGNVSSEVFCQSVRNEAGRRVTDEEIIAAWNAMLCDIAPAKLERLLELRKDYKVYLLSNTNVLHWEAARRLFARGGHSLQDYFDDVFLSFEMHQANPDAGIFQSLAMRTGLFPHETLLIDDASANCDVARSLGWHTHCVNPGEDWTSTI